MTVSEISHLLTDRSRTGAPEPTLLPWLTRRIALSGLPVAAAAGAGSVFAAQNRWPVIADAIAVIVAEREHAPGPLAEVIDILPPVAAHLDAERRARIDWPAVSPDAAGYAALGDRAAWRSTISRQPWAEFARHLPWSGILAARPTPTPPLADLPSLWWLSATPLPDAGPDTDQQAVYLLPFHPGPQVQWQAFEAIEAAVREDHHWYAAALLVRAAPYLSDRGRMREAIARLPPPWSSHLAPLADRPTAPWGCDEDELAASHPAIARLDQLAADTNPMALARTCLAVINRVRKVHRLMARWESSRYREIPEAAPPQIYRLPDDQLHLMGPGAQPPARYLNVYVAAAGQQESARPRPLALHADYVVRCNIGTADDRSLVEGEAAEFPEPLLPAGPLDLQVALFLGDRMMAVKPLTLPRTGNSASIELPLPRISEPSILHGDIAVYYGSALVLMYGLVIPFGGDSGPGPTAVPRYRLSRSLADLAKLQNRSISLAFGASRGSELTSALYINGLTFAPFGFTYQMGQVAEAAFQVRIKLYDMYLEQEGQVSKYIETGDHRYVKSGNDLAQDLAQLAQLGNRIYHYLFGPQNGTWLRDFLHDEAAARGRPPVLQAISMSDRPATIPWAALYDLPMGSDVQDYEYCPSIAQFGSGSRGPEPPARCPYEESHRAGSRWKRDQLCPWGFWGFSAIIENPPGIRTRDLETQVRPHSGPPVILVGYDTKLNNAKCQHHLRALQGEHGENILRPFVVTRSDVLHSLGPENMDVVYFYCHVLDDPAQPEQHIPAIQFGDRRITQQDIDACSQADWPEPHWAERHPLVILNGCGSVEKGPGSLTNLVDAFVETAGASGVIGTEIAIEQGVGGWAMELFLSALRDRPVGAALRSMRWEMFRSGNLMGLAYTPYCLAQLALSGGQESA